MSVVEVSPTPAATAMIDEIIAAGMDPQDATEWAFILLDNPTDAASLQPIVGRTQQELVDLYIENTCWGDDLPSFVGNHGLPDARRAALAAAFRQDWLAF